MKTRTLLALIFSLLFIVSCGPSYDKIEDISEYEKLFNEEKYDAVKTLVVDYLKEKPDNEYAWEILGDTEFQLENDQAAEEAFSKSLELNPNMISALAGMGVLSRYKGEYEKAIEYYKRALKINSNDANTLISLCVAYTKTRKFKDAIRVGYKGYILDQDNGVAAANLSIAYHYDNNFEKRDLYYKIAEKNGYKNTVTLQQIYRGELSVLD